MSKTWTLSCADLFDGNNHRKNQSLIIEDGIIAKICDSADVDDNQITLDAGHVAPGYVDLQVNGGGGVLFNDSPTVDTIRTMCDAHALFGTTSLLPTLITDTPEVTSQAIEAAILAQEQNLPGFLGLHLEGPHLDSGKHGAHDPALIHAMSDADMNELLAAKQKLAHIMITVAPESVSREQIKTLSDAGIVVSLGHSSTTYQNAQAAADAGATCVTHLFNAMSALSHREPGLVGAALQNENLYAGLIADGIHVDPAVITIALNAKQGGKKIFLVTDAMSTIGTDQKSFFLKGREITRANGRLELSDGTLAGADLDMNAAVNYMSDVIGLSADEALRMATLYPANCMGAKSGLGEIKVGGAASFVHRSDKGELLGCWRSGDKVV
ncbi:N-acetylglucosamine-6-phosphate deacetylase [Ahrensia sp. 13_GOM-1096m]|uniref:N-acetylglucosamine-6-phosphate deacetylase n=1 Tax=Ahrensia sp. 13_GOM-1096m TaxID=1380380 RepID=UPI00047CDA34|nr:N-acetylglucosamine-6-phosphate deacetylase [Ahrensia sp. 13_GOM-1096m]